MRVLIFVALISFSSGLGCGGSSPAPAAPEASTPAAPEGEGPAPAETPVVDCDRFEDPAYRDELVSQGVDLDTIECGEQPDM